MTKKTTTATTTVTINGKGVEDAIVRDVVDRIVDELRETTHEQITNIVVATMKDRIEKITEEEVRRIALAEIKDGWPEYSRWGEPQKRVTLAEYVTKLLEKRGNWGGYNSKETTWLDHMIERTISDHVTKALAEEAKAAAVRFRTAVDEIIKGKLAETLRQALGLK